MQAIPRRNVEHALEDNWRIPDGPWERIRSLLPPVPPKPRGGPPRMASPPAMDTIFYVLRAGIQRKALPRSLGTPRTVHDRFGERVKAELFLRLWQAGLVEYDERLGLDWAWQALDGAMTKAPLGGEQRALIPRIGASAVPCGRC